MLVVIDVGVSNLSLLILLWSKLLRNMVQDLRKTKKTRNT